MASVNLPEGMSPQAIAAALQFLAMQANIEPPRPTGILPASMIRGVNPRYKYEFREFPKCLVPPDIMVESIEHERKLRSKWAMPLPWNPNDPTQVGFIAEYYAQQEYPRRMSPPAVTVQDDNEEAAVKAGWRAEFGSEGPMLYPAWLFHATKPPALVNSAKERERLGVGWYTSPGEAMDEARGIKPAVTSTEEMRREAAIQLAGELGINIDARMKTARIESLIKDAQEKAVEAPQEI